MAKFLKISLPENCIGCEICILETQRQLKKVGLEGALIRISRQKNEETGKLIYSIQLDPQVNDLDLHKIRDICPTKVYTVEESEGDGGLIS